MVRSRDVKDRSFDIIFWQAQSPQARLSAARELVTFAQKIKGRAHDLRLQRSVEILRGRG